jgi:hypothetical protein
MQPEGWSLTRRSIDAGPGPASARRPRDRSAQALHFVARRLAFPFGAGLRVGRVSVTLDYATHSLRASGRRVPNGLDFSSAHGYPVHHRDIRHAVPVIGTVGPGQQDSSMR